MDRHRTTRTRPGMKAGLLVLAMLLTAGCASREPIGKVSLRVNLDKEVYKEVLKEDGTSAWEVVAGVGIGFSKGGEVSAGGGLMVLIPLTNEIAIVGYNIDRLSEVAFRQSIKWGDHTYDVDVYTKDMIVVMEGSGPRGKINKYIGELHHGDAAKSYEVVLRKIEPPAKPAEPAPATAPQPSPVPATSGATSP